MMIRNLLMIKPLEWLVTRAFFEDPQRGSDGSPAPGQICARSQNSRPRCDGCTGDGTGGDRQWFRVVVKDLLVNDS